MKLWVWIRNEWRTLLLRTALLIGFWFLLAFVVATESYFAALSGSGKALWKPTVQGVFRDWVPWMILSPVAVGLADLFRFDRSHWRRSLLIHLAACGLVALAYESLLTLSVPKPPASFFQVSMATNSAATLFPELGKGADARSNSAASNSSFLFNWPAQRVAAGPLGASNAFFGVAAENRVYEPAASNFTAGTPMAIAPAKGLQVFTVSSGMGGVLWVSPLSPWRGLLHRAVLRMQFTAPIYWCIVCVCWVLNHLQEARERERRALELEARLTQANLRALKNQLQPHFLFNTLNAISSLIHENPKAADDMVGALSEFLRMNLDVSSQNEVPLCQELEFVDRYLEIQQIRFGDRLRIRRDIHPDARNAMVPPLILQPLVENSIRHGIEARENGGVVEIRASRRDDVLSLDVSDNGEGFKNAALMNGSEGIGLSNTKARLETLYGRNHRFRLKANHPDGATVTIELPFRAAPNGSGNGNGKAA